MGICRVNIKRFCGNYALRAAAIPSVWNGRCLAGISGFGITHRRGDGDRDHTKP